MFRYFLGLHGSELPKTGLMFKKTNKPFANKASFWYFS